MRKNAVSKVPQTSQLPVHPIKCPACQSEIASDGAVLYKKSQYLEDLLETDAALEQVEKGVKGLETKLATANARVKSLELQLETATRKELPPNANVQAEGQTGKRRYTW